MSTMRNSRNLSRAGVNRSLNQTLGWLKPQAEIDRLEQYGRRDKMHIFGLEETKGEDTTTKVAELAADMGVSISANDIYSLFAMCT